VEQFGSSSGS